MSDDTAAPRPSSPANRDLAGSPEHDQGLPTTALGSLSVVRRNGQFVLEKALEPRLLNNLLLGVGFLEIANAGDFAANVWNTVPTPLYAKVLMGLGGALAIGMIYFAVRDGIKSWRNICGLQEERRRLEEFYLRHELDRDRSQTIHALLDVNRRELGCEIINRFGMDCLMGFGAFVVGLGTWLAIDSAEREVFVGSNQLTGYVGNSPCALYGLINLIWSILISWRAVRQNRAVATQLGEGNQRIIRMLHNRTSSVRFHAALNGVASAVAGAASLCTATMWWGYIVLLPCLATSVLVNRFWRYRIGYERPLVRALPHMDYGTMLDTLRYLDWCIVRVKDHPNDPLAALVPDHGSLPIVMEFITDNQLFESFCLRVLADADLAAAVFPGDQELWTVTWRDMAETEDPAVTARLLEVADKLVRDASPACFKHQQRYLLEALGSYALAQGRKMTRRPQARRLQPLPEHHRNAHTYSGRHGDNWLFGGFNITELVRQAFRT